jgi:hypothetical protein
LTRRQGRETGEQIILRRSGRELTTKAVKFLILMKPDCQRPHLHPGAFVIGLFRRFHGCE